MADKIVIGTNEHQRTFEEKEEILSALLFFSNLKQPFEVYCIKILTPSVCSAVSPVFKPVAATAHFFNPFYLINQSKENNSFKWPV